MSSAEINEKKLDLIAWINQLSDVNLISFLDGIRSSRANEDWWEELSDSQKNVIMKGLQDAEKGNLITSTEFWQQLKNA